MGLGLSLIVHAQLVFNAGAVSRRLDSKLVVREHGSELVNSQPRPSAMDHAMAIRAEERQIFELCASSGFQHMNWFRVMGLNKTNSTIAIPFGKVEAANFALERAALLEG